MAFPGRHGQAQENSRYGSGECKPLDVSSCMRSPPENSKAERDLFSSTGGPSPGYSSSLSMEKPGKTADGTDLRGSCLSPPETRTASSSCFDRGPRLALPACSYGKQNVVDFPSRWECDRTKYSSSSIVGNMSFRDKEKFLGRHEHHRRTYSLPKLESSKDWSGAGMELLEARLDRYGSALSREPVFPDLSSVRHKKHDRYDWRTREGTLFGGFSPRSGCSPSSKTNLKETCAASQQPWSSSPPFQLATQNSFSDQGNTDFDVGPMSLKKRPRLTWGEGLAKYEKEKTVEDHPAGKMCEEGRCGIVESQEEVHAFSDCQSHLTENGSFSPLHDQHHEQDSCDSGNLSGCESERVFTPKNLAISHGIGICKHLSMEFLEDKCKDNKETVKGVGASVSMGKVPPSHMPASQGSILPEVQVFVSSFWRERPTLSKDVLTHHVEKVEQEIDFLEKELVKLGSGGMEEVGTLFKTSNLKVEGQSCDTGVSSTAAVLGHSEDSSAIVIACTENLPVLHCDDVHGQLPEVPQPVQMSLNPSQSDISIKVGGDGVNPLAVTAGELQRPAVELTSTDKDSGPVESILLSNTHTAEMSLASLAHLNSPHLSAILQFGRLYDSPQQSVSWTFNAESHSRKRKRLQVKLVEEKMSANFVEKVLAVKFRAHRETWKQKQCGAQSGMQKKGKRSKIMQVQHRDDVNPLSYQSSLDSVLKSDKVHTIKTFKVGEDNRGFLQMPAMLLGREKELHSFETKNGLVDDPISAEQERKLINRWSKEEKSLFLEKYSLFGKDFRRIASYLEHKTVADCVEFYYRNQKNQEFERVRHKHQLQKHCRFQLEKYSSEQCAFCLPTYPSINSTFCEANTFCLEGLSLVAAAAAAMSVPVNKPTCHSLRK